MVFETLPRKTSLTILAFAAIVIPATLWISRSPAPQPVAAAPKPVAAPAERDFLTVPSGSLDTFYAALRRTEAKEPGAVTRVLHYGDSPTTADSITADVRRLLQQRFGDAGHGFLLIARPWAWYGHAHVELESSGWKIEPASQARAKDGIHGLGGVSFRGGPGAVSNVTLPDDQHSSGIVYYLAEPGGGSFVLAAGSFALAAGSFALAAGSFALAAGETEILTIDTAAEERQAAFAAFQIPPGTGSLQLKVTSGNVRLFGYRFDKDQPGVQYSSLGVNGAQVQMALHYFEVRQWTAALQHENPDLVVLNYGTNESIFPAYVETDYPRELRQLVDRVRAAVPHASILLMSPMDRGEMNGAAIETPATMEKVVEAQRAVAAETGCAFFDTFHAMGGPGTMARWYNQQPRLVSADFIHPLPQGAAIVGGLFESALVRSYEARPAATSALRQ